MSQEPAEKRPGSGAEHLNLLEITSPPTTPDLITSRDHLLPFRPVCFRDEHLTDELFIASNFAIAFVSSAMQMKDLHWQGTENKDRQLHAACIADAAKFILKIAIRGQKAIRAVSHLLTAVRPNGPFHVGDFSEENAHWVAYRIGIAAPFRLKKGLPVGTSLVVDDHPSLFASAILENWDSCREAMMTWTMPAANKVEAEIKWEARTADAQRKKNMPDGNKILAAKTSFNAAETGEQSTAALAPGNLITRNPISRLDLPRIVEAIEELYRAIESPPATNWQAPAWFVEQCAENLPLQDGEMPSHGWLIRAATTEVLNRLMPPNYHLGDDCPQITGSLLDQRHKVILLKLRSRLLERFFGEIVAHNRSEALLVLESLESVSKQLQDAGEGADEDGTRNRKKKEQTQNRLREGKKPLDESAKQSDKLKLQIYKRIERERDGGLRPRGILDKLKADKDFTEQVKEAGLKLDKRLIKAAHSYFLHRKRKKQDTQSR